MTGLRVMILAAGMSFTAAADTILAYWNFGADAAGYTEEVTVQNSAGVPVLTVFKGEGYQPSGNSGIAFTDASGLLHPAGQALGWASGLNDGQYWLVDVNLTGYRDLTIRWDYRASASGPSGADLEYKAGDEWHLIESISFARDSVFYGYSTDLSSFSDFENQAAVQFRLSNFTGGSGSGTFRMDNLQITAAAVPEPAAFTLTCIGGILVFIVRRASRL